jgi:hypothetical protein
VCAVHWGTFRLSRVSEYLLRRCGHSPAARPVLGAHANPALVVNPGVADGPLVDKIGTRETFARVFDALKNEEFATKQFLNSNILLLGEQESKEALDAIAKGISRLPNLGPYEASRSTGLTKQVILISRASCTFNPQAKELWSASGLWMVADL